MTHPDSSAAFEADAHRGDRATQLAELRAKIAELEGTTVKEPEDTPPVVDDTSDEESTHSVEVAGDTWRFRTPKPTALLSFGLGTANRKNSGLMMRTMQQFLAFHLQEEDFDRFLERMSNPEDRFDDENFGELINALVDAANSSAEAQAPRTGPAR